MKWYGLLAAAVMALAAVPGAEGDDKSGSTGGRDGYDTEISARGAIGRLEALSGPLWTGEGGKGMRLAVLAPEAQGDVPAYLPMYIQGLLNSNLHRHSAITLIDRQNLEKIIAEQDVAAGGRYSEVDYVSIGNLTNAQYFLIGSIQKLSGDSYALHLAVTGASSGERRAAFTGNGSLSQLEGSGSLINRASGELLAGIGVTLTEEGRASLLGGNNTQARAENALAKGAAAQATGNQVGALFNYAQAASFDPGQPEALARLGELSSIIGGGSVSERILNDIQARDRWIEVFKETSRFYREHPPFEIIFDPSLEQEGETDYARRRVNLAMRIGLIPSEAGFAALNALLRGLESTGRRDAWGFEQWPFGEIRPAVEGAKIRVIEIFTVEVLILNDRQKEVAKGSISLIAGSPFVGLDKSVLPPSKNFQIIRFRDIKADDLSPVLNIVIHSVNGISTRELNSRGYMRIAGENFTPAERAYIRGLDYYWKKDYYRAVTEYTEAIRLDPDNALYYAMRGWAYDSKKEYDRSFADINEAIRLDPNNHKYYYERGQRYYSRNDYARAIAEFTEAIRLDPNNAEYHYMRGWLYSEIASSNQLFLGGNKAIVNYNYNRAIADYTEAIRLDPDNGEYQASLERARRRGR